MREFFFPAHGDSKTGHAENDTLMRFKKINSKTISCYITQDDMREVGIRLDDIFERRTKAIEFIRGVISKASEAESLKLDGDYTSMRITVLPDKSVCLTLSSDANDTPEAQVLQQNAQNVYIYKFKSMADLIRCCRHIAEGTEMFTSLYEDPETAEYYLLIRRLEHSGKDYERLVLSVNEFGELMPSSESRAAWLQEHMKCLIPENVIETLARL